MHKLKIFLLASVFGMFFSGAWADQSQAVILEKIDKTLQKAMIDWESPGLAAAIVKDGAIIFTKGYGVRELGLPQKIDEHTLFAVGSQTKAFTAAALAILVDEGKLAWDDPVSKYLPDFRLSDSWVTRELMIRDCLTHRLGFEPLDLLWILTNFDRDELLRRYRFAKPIQGFRSAFEYHNLMFLLAGQVIPAVTGKSWDEFVKERIFLPLGMKDSGTGSSEFTQNTNCAAAHEWIDGKIQNIPWRNMNHIGPAGSIHSNLSDMAQWLLFQLGDGMYEGKRLISAEAMKEMHSPQIVISDFGWQAEMPDVVFYAMASLDSQFTTYGLGWFVQEYRNHMLVYHGGDADGMRCQTGMIPDLNLGVVIFSNLHPGTLVEALLFSIFDAFIGGESKDWSAEFLASVQAYRARQSDIRKKRAAGTDEKKGPSLPLEKYAGVYENHLYGSARVTFEGGALRLCFGRIDSALRHIRSDMFLISQPMTYIGRLPVVFFPDKNGDLKEFQLPGIAVFKRAERDNPFE